jgi:hypothetical protein
MALIGRGSTDVGQQVGLVYGFNTAGSIAGSLAGGFGLLPLLTAPGTWRLAVVLLALLGMAAFVLEVVRGGRQWGTVGLAAALGLAAGGMVFAPGPTAAWRHRAIGAGRERANGDTINALKDRSSLSRRGVFWEADGLESAIAVNHSDGFAFIVNGKSDGNSVRDAATQVLGGLMGALLHPHPASALVIGLGTGSTAGWLGAVPSMERVDVVEIEPAILKVAEECRAVNHDVLHNPKVHVFLGDAREVLLTTGRTYDVIFSEPSNPYRAGISSLFTREFYAAAKARLSENGVFVQWLQTYEVDSETIRSAYATLFSEFGAVDTWETQPGDLLLIASRATLQLDANRLRERLREEPFRKALLAVWRIDELEGFLSQFVADSRLGQSLAALGAAWVSTDDLSFMEFAFARSVGRSGGFRLGDLKALSRRLKADRPGIIGQVDWKRVEELRLDWYLNFSSPGSLQADASPELRKKHELISHYFNARIDQALASLRAQGSVPKGPLAIAMASRLLAQAGDEAAVPYIEQLRAYQEAEAEALLGFLRVRQKRHEEAIPHLLKAFEAFRVDPWVSSTTQRMTFDAAHVVAKAVADKERVKPLYDALGEPFAAHAQNDARLETRMALADVIDAKGLCVESLAWMEPHAKWTQQSLASRWRCYRLAGSPLEANARKDLEEFVNHELSPLIPRDLEEIGAPSAPAPATSVVPEATTSTESNSVSAQE